jgi:peptidoglycan/xylan/chitin deacetylase (PgdA/CDA1 family)
VSKGDVAATLLEASGLGALLRRRPPWRGVVIVNHHRVGDGTRWTTGRDVWSATAEQLDEQLRFLRRNFDVVGPDDLPAALDDTRANAVAITFDDGYRECYDVALPILQAHRVRAIFFLTTGFLDGTRAAWWDEITWMVANSHRPAVPADGWLASPVALDPANPEAAAARLVAHYKTLPGKRSENFLDYLAEATGSGRRDPTDLRDAWLDWEMVRELKRSGMGIGGHTVTHPVLAQHPAERQRAEILGSIERIAEETGERPRFFSYPDGMPGTFDSETVGQAREAGIRLAFSNYGGVAGAGAGADSFDVPRISVGHTVTARRFRAIVTAPKQFTARGVRGGRPPFRPIAPAEH